MTKGSMASSTLKDRITALRKKAYGADKVGFAGAGRFDPDDAIFKIMPEARTVICLAYRILRGCHRGIEEGTTYHHYTTMAIECLEETVMPMFALRVSSLLEQEGFTAVPQKKHQTIMNEEDSTNPEILYNCIYRGKKQEIQMDFTDAAIKCGIGETGLSGSLLTDEFGPLQRYCFVLTDAVIEETPLQAPHICDNCGECLKACPGNAISGGLRDPWQCAAYYAGANAAKNPLMGPKALLGLTVPPDAKDASKGGAVISPEERRDILTGKARLTPQVARAVLDDICYYPPVMHSYISSICGNACDRACYIHLEEKGVLTRKFRTLFRKRKEWAFDHEYYF